MLRQLLRSGQPFSGHEPHCCFLNTRGGRFANISSVSGFDIPDDGRAIGLVDWDHDGRLDCWLVNRSGPQVRLIRNNVPMGENGYLAIKLTGVKSNRDAIGARVTLTTSDGSSQVKTVRAGSGYLSQSSRWLHFGLGTDEQIAELNIRWPNGVMQAMTNLQPNRRYAIQEGGETPTALDVRQPIVLQPRKATEPARTQAARIVLTTPLVVPPLSYEAPTGEIVRLGDSTNPRLINLWSRDCETCLSELQAFSENAQRLNDSEVELITLNVDRIGSETEEGLDPKPELKPSAGFAAKYGFATERLVDQIQLLHDVVLDLHQTLPVPTSVLLDRQGRLAAFYTGPVEVDQLVSDVANLDATPVQRRVSAVPFDGQWSAKVRPPRQLRVAMDMLLRGWLEETESYRQLYQDLLSHDSDYPLLLYNLGQQYTRQQDHPRAQRLYEDAIRRRPGFGAAHYNLGVTLAMTGKLADSLPHFSKAVEADGQDVEARLNLGRTQLRLGKLREALVSLREAHAIAPNNGTVSYELAVAYALTGDVQSAGRHYERATAVDSKYAAESYRAKIAGAAMVAARALDTSDGKRQADVIRRKIAEFERKWSTAE